MIIARSITEVFRTVRLMCAKDVVALKMLSILPVWIAGIAPKIAATPRTRPSKYKEEHSDAWAAGDANVNEFYVYILKLSDGSFYGGADQRDS